ncbi:acyltransferase [Sphingomonas sp. Leaf21]|uniref:acyltransferase n=1 Tax=Sphingomonas sp. Leaf21 TaxID=2876550 RepID=UPI001E5AB117|nr:acyltransferase family protein [Sphingomonas sp. Leaf21]
MGAGKDLAISLSPSPSATFATAEPASVVAPRIDRIDGIDLMRLVAFAGVVLIHAVANGSFDHPVAADVIALCARFAVPFFFIAFGYLLARRASSATAGRLLLRLAPPFLFWSLAYVLYFEHSLRGLLSPAAIVRLLITGLDGYHLWFLPALGVAGVIFAIVQGRFGWRAVLALGVLFYALALAFGPLRLLLGLPRPPFNTRNGPFFGLLFVTAGAWLRHRDWRPTLPFALALWGVTALLQLAEVALWVRMGTIEYPRFTDDVVMTIPFGVASFLVALAMPRDFHLPPLFAHLARLSLGLYVIHALFLDLAERWLGQATLLGSLRNAGLAIIASALSVLILDRWSVTRRLIR